MTETKTINFENYPIKKWILESLKTPKARKVIIADCVKKLKLSSAEQKDTSSDSLLTLCKSRIGQILSQLITDGDLSVDADKNISLAKEIKEIYKEDEIEVFVLKLFENNEKLTRRVIFSNVDKAFLKTESKDNQATLHRLTGNVLAKAKNSETVVVADRGCYSLNKQSVYPNTPIGNCLKDAEDKDDVFEYFIKALNIKGGEFFEAYSVRLLEKYFSKFYNILSAKLTGGPTDNGIDGMIDIEDELGYKEKIFIQCKVRASAQITLKEVREFFGAVCSENGSRGLFITNSVFHGEAAKFLNKNNNLVSVDKTKLFELAKKCEYGLETKNGKLYLDANMFLNDDFKD